MLIPYALLTLGAIFGFAVAWVLNAVWKVTFGAFFVWLGNLGISISLPRLPDVSIHPFGKLLDFNNGVQSFLSQMAASYERAIVRLFHQTVAALGGLSHELGALAQAIERRIVSLVGGTIPRLVRAALGNVLALARKIPALVRRVDNLVRYVERKVKAGIAAALRLAYRQLRHIGRAALGVATDAWKRIKRFGLRLAHLERLLHGKHWKRHLLKGLLDLGLGVMFSSSVGQFLKGVMGWEFKLVKAVVRYFARLGDPFSIEGFVKVEQELLKLTLHELEFIISEFSPERLAPPGPPFGPPA